jgi:hypothetical protein
VVVIEVRLKSSCLCAPNLFGTIVTRRYNQLAVQRKCRGIDWFTDLTQVEETRSIGN